MAALSDNVVNETRNRGATSYVVKNGVQIYAGALVGIDTSTGYLVPWANSAAYRFVGISKDNVLGDTSASPPKEARVDDSGVILKNAAVANAATQASEGDLVYCTSDNPADLSTTAPSAEMPIGRIIRWISAGVCDVVLFTPYEARAASITTLTDATTGTVGNTIADVGTTFNQGTLNNNFASLAAKVNAILKALS